MFRVIDHAVVQDMTREERLQRRRESYRLRRDRETPEQREERLRRERKIPPHVETSTSLSLSAIVTACAEL